LYDPSNLIYILGRNSAGKTALLTAIAHFAPDRKPEDYANFANYNRRADTPHLTARYRINAGDLSVDQLMADHTSHISALNQGTAELIESTEFRQFLEDIAAQVRPIYDEAIQQFEQAGEVFVERSRNGDYCIFTDGKIEEQAQRLQQIANVLDSAWQKVRPDTSIPANHILAAGQWRPVQSLTAQGFEDMLFKQFPRIVWFGDAFLLRDVLPPNITLQNVDSRGPLLQAFIALLDPDTVQRFLSAENPSELDDLLRAMQDRLDSLIQDVNRAARNHGIPDLLEMTLYSRDGLQINVKANGKFSYYQHISDNTKFLFAYFLYLRTHKIEGSILLFDEPSNGFHATAQEELLRFLEELGREGNLVVVSTHSEHLIDPDHLTGVRLMEVDKQGYLRVRNRWYASTGGQGDFQALRPILDAIGLKYGNNRLTIRDRVIVTEGVTDLLYLRAFRQMLGVAGDLHIAPATGDETIPHVVALLISQGLKFKVLTDTTVGKKGVADKLEEAYGIPKTSMFLVPIPPTFPSARGSGVEDLFSKDDFAKLLAATGNPPGSEFTTMPNSAYMSKHATVPKRVVAHQFLQEIGSYNQSDFDAETIENARRVLEFCQSDAWCEI
jgi:energy-coupling factor transporter ATP-binding protein EcfA2